VPARLWPKILIGLCALGLVAWLFASGNYAEISIEGIRRRLLEAGGWGMLAFLLASLLQPLGVSGHLTVLAASLVWPPGTAFALCLLGASCGQFAWFFAYRYLAHEWAQRHIPARLRRYERVLIERPFAAVVLFRILSFTWPLAPAILGVSRVRVQPMLLGTVVGLAPTVAFDVWLGELLLRWLRA
jgi:uncharacterized membrane protein YdjX (TVP38/TMEM64 family)